MAYDVITIGSATRDATFRSKNFKLLKNKEFLTGRGLGFDLGTKIAVDDVFFGTGGAGTNTAVTFSRQGFKTAAIVRIGEDVVGDAVRRELKQEKVDTRFIQYDLKLNTAYSIILEHSSGERTILTHRGANNKLNSRDMPWKKLKSSWIYLSSLSADMRIVKGAVGLKKKYGTKIAWNPGGTDLRLGLLKLKPYLKNIDVFIVNQEEAARLLSIPYKNVKQIFTKFDDVIDGLAVMTQGPKGVLVSDGETLWEAGIFKEKKVVDRTGAGDSFGSGFVAGLMRHLDTRCPNELGHRVSKFEKFCQAAVEYALRFASANATSKVEQMGAKTGLLTKKEFNNSRWKKLTIKTTQLGHSVSK